MSLFAGVVVVVMIVGGLALTIAGGDGGRRSEPFETTADPAVSTTLAPEPVTTVQGGSARRTAEQAPAATPSTTVAPRPAIAPDRTRPAGTTYDPHAVWPETLAELDRLQAAVDQGHQPWRNDPPAVARAYLQDRGVADPAMGSFEATSADAGSVRYTVAGMSGRVDLHPAAQGLDLVRGRLTLRHASGRPGVPPGRVAGCGRAGGADAILIARAKRPGGAWGAERSAQVFAGGTRSITVTPR